MSDAMPVEARSMDVKVAPPSTDPHNLSCPPNEKSFIAPESAVHSYSLPRSRTWFPCATSCTSVTDHGRARSGPFVQLSPSPEVNTKPVLGCDKLAAPVISPTAAKPLSVAMTS